MYKVDCAAVNMENYSEWDTLLLRTRQEVGLNLGVDIDCYGLLRNILNCLQVIAEIVSHTY
jgi:hypothetical protein